MTVGGLAGRFLVRPICRACRRRRGRAAPRGRARATSHREQADAHGPRPCGVLRGSGGRRRGEEKMAVAAFSARRASTVCRTVARPRPHAARLRHAAPPTARQSARARIVEPVLELFDAGARAAPGRLRRGVGRIGDAGRICGSLSATEPRSRGWSSWPHDRGSPRFHLSARTEEWNLFKLYRKLGGARAPSSPACSFWPQDDWIRVYDAGGEPGGIPRLIALGRVLKLALLCTPIWSSATCRDCPRPISPATRCAELRRRAPSCGSGNRDPLPRLDLPSRGKRRASAASTQTASRQ